MKFPLIKTFASISLVTAGAMLYGCAGTSSSSSASAGTAQYVADNLELKGDFTENVTLEAGKKYKINGEVNFLSGTTLTIPAGTTLYGSTPASYLAINAGAKIMANGTQAAPIYFTSAEEYELIEEGEQ